MGRNRRISAATIALAIIIGVGAVGAHANIASNLTAIDHDGFPAEYRLAEDWLVYRQLSGMCAAFALAGAAQYYGMELLPAAVFRETGADPEHGTSVRTAAEAARRLGYGVCASRIAIKDIKRAVYSGAPVVISIRWNDGYSNARRIMRAVGNPRDESHAMVCVGWNSFGLLLLNSHGAGWGVNGCAYYSYRKPIEAAYSVTVGMDHETTTAKEAA